MRGVHQVVAGAAARDAISAHVISAQARIRELGVRSEIFCDPAHLDPGLRGRVLPDTDWGGTTAPGDIAILHYSIASPAFDRVLAAGAPAALHYHNVTPASLLWTFNPGLARQCAEGRQHLASVVERVRWVAADSAFNAGEIADLGSPHPTVIGVLREQGRTEPRRPRAADDGRLRLLFVGRGVPNKAQHDCILALAALRQTGTDAELHLVGSWGSSPAYAGYCRALVHAAGVDDRVAFHGSVSAADLARAFATADYFLCLSDHEGYCVPVIEALEARLPVIAYRAGAVPETLGQAGLLLDDKTPSLVAEAVLAAHSGEVCFPEDERGRQVEHHGAAATGDRLLAFVREMLDDPA